MKIGFIGLGIMGSRMAKNLANAGYHLYIYNRTKEKADPLLSDRVEWCTSPGMVANNANVIFTMLSTPEVVQEIALGEEGLLSGMMKGNVWVDCSTVNPSFSRQMADITEELGFNFLDAPVAGSLTPAEKGELVFLAGGKKEIVKYCSPLFKIMGKKVVHAGEHGKGSALKLVNNLVMGRAMYGVAEGLMLGEHLGLDKKEILDLLDGSPIAPAMVGMKKEKFLTGDYSPEFPLQWLQKDLHLAAQSAYEEGSPLPATNLIKEIFALASKSGLAERDFTAVYKYLSELAK
jgi:3-hydroxyisobutyrate dehydrogenase/glyoxylate/succinic semialdehyde reductase